MPKYWYDYFSINKPTDDDAEAVAHYEFERRLVANKKPYFMIYIYPLVKRDYMKFIRSAGRKAVYEFGKSLDTLLASDDDELTGREREFIDYYNRLMPVGTHACTMNRICWKVEEAFKNVSGYLSPESFDPSILKSGTPYTRRSYDAIKELVEEHARRLQAIGTQHGTKSSNSDIQADYMQSVIQFFKREAEGVCNNSRALCDIIVDVCYRRSGTKQFVWDIVPEQVIENMLEKSNHMIHYPVLDPDGEIEYGGDTYSMVGLEVDIDAIYIE